MCVCVCVYLCLDASQALHPHDLSSSGIYVIRLLKRIHLLSSCEGGREEGEREGGREGESERALTICGGCDGASPSL